MISAGEVGAVFIIKDEASAVLRLLMDQFNELQLSIDKTKLALAELTVPPGLNRSLGRMDKTLTSVGNSAEVASGKATAGFAKIDESVAVTQARVAALKAEMRGLGPAGVGRGGLGGVGANGLPVPAGRGGRRTGKRGAGEKEHLPLHTNIHAAGVGMRSHDGEMIAGAVVAFSAWEALKASAELKQVQANLQNAGVSNAEIAKATATAYKLGAKYGLTAKDILQGMNETRNPLNRGETADSGMEAAIAHSDTLMRAAVVLKAQDKKTGGSTADELYDMVKANEFKNKIGDADFDNAIGGIVRASQATGGIVTPRAFLQMSQMLKSALPGLSDQYLYEIMPELAQEFRGQSAGTAGASLYQQLISGQMRTTGIGLLHDLDMVDMSKVTLDHDGHIVKMKPGAYKDSETFKSDPLKGMADLIDAMNKHGITDEGKQRDELSQIFGNRNAAQMAMTLAFQYARLMRGAQGIRNTHDLKTSSDLLLKDNPDTQWDQFTTAATNAGASIGDQLMPGATAALTNLTATVNAAGSLFRGEFSDANFHDLFFGNGKEEGGFFESMQKWIQDHSPIAPIVQKGLKVIGGAIDGSGTDGTIDPGQAERERIFHANNPWALLPGKTTLPVFPTTTPWPQMQPPIPAPIVAEKVPGAPSVSAPVLPPINVTAPISASITAPLAGTATVTTGAINLVVSGASIVAALGGAIEAKIAGAFAGLGRATGSSNGSDIQAHPSYPDHAVYGHGL